MIKRTTLLALAASLPAHAALTTLTLSSDRDTAFITSVPELGFGYETTIGSSETYGMAGFFGFTLPALPANAVIVGATFRVTSTTELEPNLVAPAEYHSLYTTGSGWDENSVYQDLTQGPKLNNPTMTIEGNNIVFGGQSLLNMVAALYSGNQTGFGLDLRMGAGPSLPFPDTYYDVYMFGTREADQPAVFTLTYEVVPEPSALILGVLGMFRIFHRRRS